MVKLTYFNLRGRGEGIRYLLHQAGVPFEDCRIEMDQWPALKPNTPTGTLPTFEHEKVHLATTNAIARLIARKHNLTGKDNVEAASCDMYVDGLDDMFTGLRPIGAALILENDEPKAKAEFAKFKESHLKSFMDRYEKFLEKNGTGYFVGDQVTWADIIIAEWMERFVSCMDSTVLDKHPKLKAHCERIHNLPNIKKYVATRPKTKM